MTIDPELIIVTSVNEIPTVPLSELQTGQMFGYTGTGDLKKVSTNELLGFIKSGIKGNATQANAPTPYTAEDFPNGLFETYVVRTPLTMPNNWGSAVTQAELDANNVYFDVKNGVITKSLSFKNNEILEGSVTPQKTTFATDVFSYGKNRFDKSTVTVGKYVNAITGSLSDNSNYLASDFIFIGDLQLQFITFSPQLIHVAFYSEKNAENFISGREYGEETIIVPQNAKWLRCSLYDDGMKETFQIENGISETNYENFQSKNGIFIEGIILPAKQDDPLPEILIPTINWLAYGIEYNFYFKSFIVPKIAEKLENYYCSAFGYRGKFLEKKVRVGAYDDFNFFFKVEDSENSRIKNVNFKTAPANNGSGQNRKILVIGDSTVNHGIIVKHISDYFASDVMNVTMIGTRQSMGVNHEGRSGWTMQNYIESTNISGVENPFSSGGTFNFSNYLTTTNQTMGTNDWVFIQLGINDLYATSLMDGSQTESVINTRINDIKLRLELIINSIKSHNPNIRIGIIQTFPPAISQDATGNLLNSSFYSLEYYLKKGLAKWWEYLLEFYDNQDKRDARIYLIGANSVIDRENDFITANQNIDQYDSTQVEVQVDDVHPVDGYKQVGDMYIGAIKYFG